MVNIFYCIETPPDIPENWLTMSDKYCVIIVLYWNLLYTTVQSYCILLYRGTGLHCTYTLTSNVLHYTPPTRTVNHCTGYWIPLLKCILLIRKKKAIISLTWNAQIKKNFRGGEGARLTMFSRIRGWYETYFWTFVLCKFKKF